MAVYTTPVDVANRALQIIGVPRITTFSDSSKAARETAFAIDKVRQADLRRSVWTFATRRAILRPIIAATQSVFFLLYNAATTYAVGDIVKDSSGFPWISMVAGNVGNTPGAGGLNSPWVAYFGPMVATRWDATTQFFPGDILYVLASATVYIAVAPSLNQTPPNATYWHVVAGATMGTIVQISPLGVNPPTGATTRNIYRLPANYVRMAPQDPKAAANVRQGTLAGMIYNDWEIENGYLFTADAGPIIFRFVADETDVMLMDALFCEAWAAHTAVEVCEPLTQSVQKKQDAKAAYGAALSMAKAMNAVEGGSTEPEVPEGGGGGQGGQGQPANQGQ